MGACAVLDPPAAAGRGADPPAAAAEVDWEFLEEQFRPQPRLRAVPPVRSTPPLVAVAGCGLPQRWPAVRAHDGGLRTRRAPGQGEWARERSPPQQ